MADDIDSGSHKMESIQGMSDTQQQTMDAATQRATPDRPADIHIRPATGWQPVDLGELWRFRHLVWLFSLRDVTVRYKQTMLGGAWALIQPLVQTVVFTLFFGKLMGLEDNIQEFGGQAWPYAVFVLSGQVMWNFFNSAASASANSLLANGNILRKIYVPRMTMPIASTGAPVADTLIAVVLLLGMMAWYCFSRGLVFSWTALLLPLTLVMTLLTALSVGVMMSALIVTYRDVRFVLPFVLQIWFFVTPVIYPPSIIPEKYQALLYLNPMSGIIDFNRAILLGGELNILGLGISLAMTSVLLVMGTFYFARVEKRFADIT